MPELKDNEVIVTREEVQTWLNKVKELNQLRADLENDIGWVARAIDNAMNVKNAFKLATKIMRGKVDLKELGLDDERLEKITERYAPKTYAEIQQKKKDKSK